MEWCKNCEKDVDPVPEDGGIGPYEFWGAKGFDSHMAMVCPECEEILELSYGEWKAEQDACHADYMNDCERDRRAEEEWDRKHGG